VLGVRMKADGNIERVEVRSRSGVQTWDDEASAVMGRAQPFPAPPPELLDARKGISISWEWDSYEFDRDVSIARYQKEVAASCARSGGPRPPFASAAIASA
jgi:TonB family protein